MGRPKKKNEEVVVDTPVVENELEEVVENELVEVVMSFTGSIQISGVKYEFNIGKPFEVSPELEIYFLNEDKRRKEVRIKLAEDKQKVIDGQG
jgi:hypothetical protein